MIKETSTSSKKRVVPQGDVVLDISRSKKNKTDVSAFAPSQGLQNDWKQGRIVWKQYVERYYGELRENEEVSSLITEIADLAVEEDVWLVSMEREYPCHRFLVKQIIERILAARGVLKEPEDYSESYRSCKNLTHSQIRALREPKRKGKPARGRDPYPLVPILRSGGDR